MTSRILLSMTLGLFLNSGCRDARTSSGSEASEAGYTSLDASPVSTSTVSPSSSSSTGSSVSDGQSSSGSTFEQSMSSESGQQVEQGIESGHVESQVPEFERGYGSCFYKCVKVLRYAWYFQHKGNCDSQIYCSAPATACDAATNGETLSGYCSNYPGQSIP